MALDIFKKLIPTIPKGIIQERPKIKPKEIEKPSLPSAIWQGITAPFEATSRFFGALITRRPITESPSVFELVEEKVKKLPVVGKIPGLPFIAGLVAESPLFGVGAKRRVAEKLAMKSVKIKSTAKALIKNRYSEIKTGLVDTEVFAKKIERILPKKIDREAIPFIIEGTIKGTKTQQKVAKKVSDYFDEGFKFLEQNLDEVGFRENYVNHIWDIPRAKQTAAISRFITKNPFTKQRTIPTLAEGIKMGLKPKTTDISELLRIYDVYKHSTVANTKFVRGLNKLTDDTGQKLIQRIDKAPAEWKTIDHPALKRAIGIPITKGKMLLPKIPVKVHPEIAKEVEVVLGKPFSGRAVRALDTIYAFTKKAALSLSFFHHIALTESAISAGVGRKAFRLWNPVKIYNALKKGKYQIFKDIPLTKDALRHQLQLGALPDVQRHRVHQAFQAAERRLKKVPILGKTAKLARGANELWDKALWDYYHNGLKIQTYESWVQDSIKKFPGKPVNQIKDDIARLVNDTFGGQVWENLMVTPKMQQILHWMLLSPDWTLSTLRQAAAPLVKGVRGMQGRKFWLRAGLYFYGGANILNYVNTKRYTGEGKYMWENDPKHKTLIFIGFDESGQKKYLRFGKQFREIFEWVGNPLKKFAGKLAPVTREAITQLVGYTPTGWKTEFAGKELFDVKALEARAKELLGLGLPYSISTITRSKNILGIAFPISKGLSWYEGRELMMDAIDKQDKDYLAEIWRALLENNVDAKKVFQSAKSEVKLKERPEFKETEKLINKLRKLGKEEGIKKLQEMRESGELTPEVEKQMIQVLKGQAEVKQQKERLDIQP